MKLCRKIKHILLNRLSAWFLTCQSIAIWPRGLSRNSCPGAECLQLGCETGRTEQCSSTRGDLAAQGNSATPRAMPGSQLASGGETQDVAKHPTMHRTISPAPGTSPQNYLTQNVNSATVILLRAIEKPPKRAGTKNSGAGEGRRIPEGVVVSTPSCSRAPQWNGPEG